MRVKNVVITFVATVLFGWLSRDFFTDFISLVFEMLYIYSLDFVVLFIPRIQLYQRSFACLDYSTLSHFSTRDEFNIIENEYLSGKSNIDPLHVSNGLVGNSL